MAVLVLVCRMACSVCQAAGPNVWDVDSEQAHAGPPQQLRIEPLMEDSSEPDGTAFY